MLFVERSYPILFLVVLTALASTTSSWASFDTYQEYQKAAMSGKPMTNDERIEWARKLEAATSDVKDTNSLARMLDEAGALYNYVGDSDHAKILYDRMLEISTNPEDYSSHIIALQNKISMTRNKDGYGESLMKVYEEMEQTLQNMPAEQMEQYRKLLEGFYGDMASAAYCAAQNQRVPLDYRQECLDKSIKYYNIYFDNITDENNPDVPNRQYDLGHAYLLRGESARAADTWMALLESGKSTMTKSGVFLDAMDARYGPYAPQHRVELEKYLATHEPDEATCMLKYRLAHHYLRSKEYEKAIAIFEEALNDDTTLLGSQDERLIELASALLLAGRQSEAEALYREIIRTYPDTPSAASAKRELEYQARLSAGQSKQKELASSESSNSTGQEKNTVKDALDTKTPDDTNKDRAHLATPTSTSTSVNSPPPQQAEDFRLLFSGVVVLVLVLAAGSVWIFTHRRKSKQ